MKDHSPLDSFARLDFHRRERTGIPEAILAEGKTTEQVLRLVDAMVRHNAIALVTRCDTKTGNALNAHYSQSYNVEINEQARVVVVRKKDHAPGGGGVIAILAAGTSDIPVAEEARVTAEVMGCHVLRYYDVGVAGIHRLVSPLEDIREKEAAAVVVVAGMEGALPTVVRGLVPVPVIGVPTSIGYGYGGAGKAALMTMLQSCSPGLTVVNIDNGFGAGATAALIANRLADEKKKNARRQVGEKPSRGAHIR